LFLDLFQKRLFLEAVYRKVGEAERQIESGNTASAQDVAADMKAKYGL